MPSNVINPYSPESIGSTLSVLGGISAPASATNPTGSFCVYVPFFTTAPMLINSVYWHNGSTVAGNVDVGVYDAGRVRLFSSGVQLQSGTTNIQVTQIPQQEIGVGMFFMGLCVSNVTGTLFSTNFFPGNSGTGLVSACGVYQQGGNAFLPTTGTFINPIADWIPLFGISSKAII